MIALNNRPKRTSYPHFARAGEIVGPFLLQHINACISFDQEDIIDRETYK